MVGKMSQYMNRDAVKSYQRGLDPEEMEGDWGENPGDEEMRKTHN